LFKSTFRLVFVGIIVAFAACRPLYAPPFENTEKIGQIYLTSHFKFSNGSEAKGIGSAFLIKHSNKIYAVTARHVAETRAHATQLNSLLEFWYLYPKSKYTYKYEVDELLTVNELKDEWWLLSLKKKPKGIEILKPRFEPVEVGEKVLL